MAGYRESAVIELLENLQVFYRDLNRLIAQYEMPLEWESTPFSLWKLDKTFGICSDQKHIYICHLDSQFLGMYNLNGDIIKTISLSGPVGITIDIKEKLIYIADLDDLIIFNVQLEKLTSWKLPGLRGGANERWLKIDENILYLTTWSAHKVFLFESQKGKFVKDYHSDPGNSYGQPVGLTIYKQLLYFCDYDSHCICILKKNTGRLVTQWGTKGQELGQFISPVSIYHDTLEFFYIGDSGHVHVYTLDGQCIARIGDKFGKEMNQFGGLVYGICEVNDNLYTSDRENDRILIFKRK